MTKIIPALFLILLFSGRNVSAQEKMTPDRFREIAAMPGDDVPLDSQFAMNRPYWPKTKWSVSLTDWSYTGTNVEGKTVRDEGTTVARTVRGKYIVSTVQSRLRGVETFITTNDAKPGTFHVYRFIEPAGVLTVATYVNDPQKKTFSGVEERGNGVKALNNGSYTDKVCKQKVMIYQDDVLIMTQEFTLTPDPGDDTK